MKYWELKWLNVLKYVKHQVDNEYESSNVVTQEEKEEFCHQYQHSIY